jgi:hypothetical protein
MCNIVLFCCFMYTWLHEQLVRVFDRISRLTSLVYLAGYPNPPAHKQKEKKERAAQSVGGAVAGKASGLLRCVVRI